MPSGNCYLLKVEMDLRGTLLFSAATALRPSRYLPLIYSDMLLWRCWLQNTLRSKGHVFSLSTTNLGTSGFSAFSTLEPTSLATWPTDLSRPSFLRSSGLRSLFPGDLSPLLIGDLRSPFFRGDLSLSPLLIGDLSRLIAGDLSRFAGDLSRLSPIMTFGGFLLRSVIKLGK